MIGARPLFLLLAAAFFVACGGLGRGQNPDSRATTDETSPEPQLPAPETTNESSSEPQLPAPERTNETSSEPQLPVPTARPVLFRFAVKGPCAAHFQAGGLFRLNANTGALVRHEDSCGTCNCDQAKCAVCGAPIPSTEVLAPGALLEVPWNGLEWKGDSSPQSTCERPVNTPDGTLYVSVTYSHNSEQSETSPGEVLVAPVVSSLTAFDFPADVVEIALDTTPFVGRPGATCIE